MTKKTKALIQEIKQGDTVEYKGEFITVGEKDIKYCNFMGYSFKGDASSKYITKINFIVPTNKGFSIR